MLGALGSVSSVLNSIQALTSSGSLYRSTGHNTPNPFDHSCDCTDTGSTPSASASGAAQISPATLSALIAAQAHSTGGSSSEASHGPSEALRGLFGKLDGDGNGKISKSEFENTLGAGGTNNAPADSVFGKLDKDGDGSVSVGELASALGAYGHKHHRTANGDDDLKDIAANFPSNANPSANNENRAASADKEAARTKPIDVS